MFTFQPKRKIGGLAEELSSESAEQNRPFVGSVSNSELIQLLSGSTPYDPDSPNTGSSQNTSGVPAGLKAKYEQLSGVSMDDVSVHYNSDKPIQYGALAYTQGNDVYLGPGQEQHLSHELGHVIQQKQGRVPVTGSVGGAPLNDDPALEHEADSLLSGNSPVQHITAGHHPDSGAPIQRLRINLSGEGDDGDPVIYRLQYFNIPTGGGRLSVPDSDHDKVIATVCKHKNPLTTDEDIVFEGHGCPSEDETTVSNLQYFRPKELAKMAASIPKPENWQGKIILFGCSAGDIAPQVAEEYYKITGNSVTVVGAKKNISVITDSNSTPVRFGFLENIEELAFLQKTFSIYNDTMLYDLQSISKIINNPLCLLNHKILLSQSFIFSRISWILDKIELQSQNAPSTFSWDSSCNVGRTISTLNKCLDRIETQARKLNYIRQLHPLDCEKEEKRLSELDKLCNEAIRLYNQLHATKHEECLHYLKAELDFDDKEMMISATYTDEDDDIAFSLAQRTALFGSEEEDDLSFTLPLRMELFGDEEEDDLSFALPQRMDLFEYHGAERVFLDTLQDLCEDELYPMIDSLSNILYEYPLFSYQRIKKVYNFIVFCLPWIVDKLKKLIQTTPDSFSSHDSIGNCIYSLYRHLLCIQDHEPELKELITTPQPHYNEMEQQIYGLTDLVLKIRNQCNRVYGMSFTLAEQMALFKDHG